MGDVDSLSRWLTHRLGRDVRVTQSERLARGVSRETWAVDAGDLALVVRRDHAAGSVIPSALMIEHETYARLAGSGLPLAEALLVETDPAWQPDGRPACVRLRVEGHWHLPVLASEDPADDDERVRLSRAHLDALAAVHAVDWRAHRLDEVLPLDASAADLVHRTRALVERLDDEPSPVLAAACAALLAGAPAGGDVVLCKSTNGHGEEVWRDGELVALSDWELARLGDPAYDLAQVQEMVPEIVRDGRRVWGWPEALEHYRSRTDRDVDLTRVQWYRQAYGLLQLAYCAHAGEAVRRLGTQAPLRFVWTAYEVGHHAEQRLLAAAGAA